MQRLKFLYQKYSASPFVRNVSKLTGATAFAQLISLATAPLLYRIYDKEDYGLLGVYMSIAATIGAFSTMQYSQTVLLEKEETDALNALWLVRLINSTVAVLVLIGVLLFGNWLLVFLKSESLSNFLYLLPVSIFFTGQNELFRIWANRHKKYNIMTMNSVLTSVLVPAISITLGLLYNSPWGLFIGLLSSQIFPSLFMAWQLGKEFSFGWKPPKIQVLKRIAKRHMDFPKYSLPAEFINRFSNQLPTFMLSRYAGPGAVAAYNLSVRMLSLPIQLLSASITEVFKQRAVEDYNLLGNCRTIFVKTFKTLLGLSMAPTLVILFFGPSLFVFFFGGQWRDAGVYSQILAALYFVRFIVSPLSYVFNITRKQREDFLWHIWMLVSSFVTFYVGFHLFESSEKAIALFSINYVLIYVIYLYKSFHYAKEKVDTLF